MKNENLNQLRNRIDEINLQLLHLLNERTELVDLDATVLRAAFSGGVVRDRVGVGKAL